mmetsp:Transcript_1047/g.1214  ORF Transcript_1047/g.1214 Transcript_1047/m.1214 type:complete len:171 (-) Transcript_1047:82-594(-)
MEALREKYQGVATFVKVYVSEAHPTDEWKVYADIDYCQPVTLKDRAAAAQKLLQACPQIQCAILLDTMSNTAEKTYAAHPERHYIIERDSGTIVYKGGMGPFGYKVEEVDEFISKYRATLPGCASEDKSDVEGSKQSPRLNVKRGWPRWAAAAVGVAAWGVMSAVRRSKA